MRDGRNDVDGESDEKSSNCRVDGAKEGENNGQEPYRNNHR